MSQTNGQHEELNGPGGEPEFSVPTGPPISDFLTQLQDYNTTIPDTVTSHYLATAGLETTDPRIVKLVSLAAQKFVSDVAADALTHCKMKQNTAKKAGKDSKLIMTTEDLSSALSEQGVNVKKPMYYQ